MKKHLLSFAITLLPGFALACSCISITTFCERVTPESEVISVKILTGYYVDFTHYIDVIFIENVQGDTSLELLTLRTGSGNSCDPFPDMFVGGDTLVFIMGLQLGNSPSPHTTFMLDFACGSNFLIVSNGKVTIGPYFDPKEVTYPVFKNNFGECAKINPPLTGWRAPLVYPSPALAEVFLENNHQSAIAFQVFTSTGKLVTEGDLPSRSKSPFDVSDWPAGVYFIRFGLDGELLVERFVVH